MSIFLDILALLTSSPGAMVYYLALLLSVWAMIGLALSRWSRGERYALVPRLLAAGGLISFSRFMPIVIAVLDRQNGAYLVPVGPPLERFVDALSAVLICWAFVVPDRQRTVSRVFFGVTTLFSIGLYVVAATQWASALQANSSLSYNLYWHRWLWELWQLFFLLPALVYLIVTAAPERGLLVVSLGTLAAGHLAQAIVPFAEQIPHFAGWVRFANLLAFPLLAIALYRMSIQQFDIHTKELQTTNQESLSRIAGLMTLVDTHQKMSSSLEIQTVLENAVYGLSQALQSSLCAIALAPSDPGETGTAAEIEIPVVYNEPRLIRETTRFTPNKYPIIDHAITRGKAFTWDTRGSRAPSESSEVTQIYHLLGSEQSGPLLVQPLGYQAKSMGVILACRPDQTVPFTSVDAHRCETLATQVVSSIENARQYQRSRAQIERLQADVQLLKTEYVRTKADLENRIKKAQHDLTLYIQKLYETELGEQRAQKDAAELRQQLARQKEESQAEVARRKKELQQTLEQADRLTKRIARLDSERLKLEERIQALEHDNEELQFQVAATVAQQVGHAPEAQAALAPQPVVPQGSNGDSEDQPSPLPADDRLRARDEFLASLAQDLRTPMTSILGYTELLMNESVGKLEGIQRKFLQRVQANIERMHGMLNDLIGITVIDAGKLVIELEPVDAVSIIETALHKVQFRLEEKELGVQLEIDDLPAILADPECMQQIVDNLLTNACKSSISGSTITIRANVETAEANKPQLHVSVSDTGGGIATVDQTRVFERFYRADNALIVGLGETGVGLSIVKSLVEAHQGKVWIESEAGIGTLFHFTIPYGLEPAPGDYLQQATVAEERTPRGE